jgi:CubicO group peptidase (beta-lactamase class C family)
MPPLDVGILAAAGSLRSTPSDLSRFVATILSGSGIAPEAELLLSVRRGAPWNGVQALGWEVRNAPGGVFVSKDGVCGQAASIVFDPDRRLGIVAVSNTMPDLSYSTPPGGGVGTADIARHLLRPQVPLSGQGGTRY